MELRRRYSVRCKVDADTWPDFQSALREIYLALDTEHMGHLDKVDMVSAGRSYSYAVFGVQKPEITPEVYREKLETYVREQVTKNTKKP